MLFEVKRPVITMKDHVMFYVQSLEHAEYLEFCFSAFDRLVSISCSHQAAVHVVAYSDI